MKGSNKTVDHCPTCGADAAGARFCNMCGARLLADVLVDTAGGQAARPHPDFAATAPVALPEQFEALFRPMRGDRPIDATQPMAALPEATRALPLNAVPSPARPSGVGGLPSAPLADEGEDGHGPRRRLLAAVAVLATLIALIVIVAVLVTGGSGTAASGTRNVATTSAAASSTAPPAAANNPAAGAGTTAATKGTTTGATTASRATTTTAKSDANAWPGNLGPGSHGTRVKEVQQALRDEHLYFGRVSGEYDTSTAAAVLIFQTQHHITGDPYGTVGQATWNALVGHAG